MKIGLISDTHGFLEDGVFKHFENCDEVWHAGDIGTEEVLNKLEEFKPTRAVYGNIDGHELRTRTQEGLIFEIEGQRVLITHIAGKPPKYNSTVRKYLSEYQPNILICGHSHFLKIERDTANNLLFLNPGAAGRHGFHKIKTLLRFDILEGKISNMEVVELGPRSKVT